MLSRRRAAVAVTVFHCCRGRKCGVAVIFGGAAFVRGVRLRAFDRIRRVKVVFACDAHKGARGRSGARR